MLEVAADMNEKYNDMSADEFYARAASAARKFEQAVINHK